MANREKRENNAVAAGRRGVRQVLRHNLWAVILAIATPVFLWCLEQVAEGELTRLDSMAYRVVVQGMRSDWLTPIMQSFSELGQIVVLVVLILAIAVFAPGKHPARMATLNLVCVVVLNQALKFIVQRPRPDGFRLAAASGYSFPSGHSMVAMGFYGLLVWMAWHYYGRHSAKRWLAAVGFSVIIVGVGLSRVYLGVHYASDVVAGFCVSLIWLVFFTRVVVPVLFPDRKDGPTPSSESGRSVRSSTARHMKGIA